jgi:transcriptional regulator of nitric oxide reductase
VFEPKPDVSSRRWLPGVIAAALIAIVFLAGMDRKALIKRLPFGMAERILDRDLPEHLRQVFPDATAFSKKQTKPLPHYIAYNGEPGSQTVTGYVFWTTELQPDERGYDGPIEMLVGLDMNGKLTGVLVTEQHEPYGYFSVGLPSFARQFKGKDIRDPFKVGQDVAAISRASISVNSASRAIRNSARLAARSLIELDHAETPK